ncbi:MAG: AMP-binding protein [Burkholderiaceae bacterium]|nr:AMP-binding protein [Burkholderiaceae bacterium]
MPEAPARTVTTAHGIAAMIAQQAMLRGDAPALLAQGEPPLSYARLSDWLEQSATFLRSIGVTRTSRVAVSMQPGPEAALTTLATLCAAVCIPLDPAAGEDDFGFRLRDCAADFVLTDSAERAFPLPGLRRLVVGREFRLPGRSTRTGVPASNRAPHDATCDTVDADATCLLLHTSGTTAMPKRVPLSQRNVLASARANTQAFGLGPQDRCLNVLSLLHVGGIVTGMLTTLVSGGSLVCPRGFDAEAFFPLVAEFEPTWYTGTPTIHLAVLPFLETYRRLAPNHRFRFLRSATSPIATELIARLECAFGAPLLEAYGMTEAGRISCNPAPPGLRKPGSVGVPVALDVRVVGSDSTDLRCGEIGEIVVRGDSVTRGYLDDDVANTTAFRDGWFHTGDLGRFDEDGYLFLEGRIKEVVNRGGRKIAPREIDAALAALPGVREAAAFGMPHPSLGEDLVAVVVAEPGPPLDVQALRTELLARLARHKVPSSIVVVDSLPRGASGKIQRSKLAAVFGALSEAGSSSPQTPAEAAVAAIVESVLGADTIGRGDNFFLSGGDSLSAARVAARCATAFGLARAPAANLLFAYPTVEALAAELLRLRQEQAMDEEMLAQLEQLSDEELARLLSD